jgi:hypothetical protein
VTRNKNAPRERARRRRFAKAPAPKTVKRSPSIGALLRALGSANKNGPERNERGEFLPRPWNHVRCLGCGCTARHACRQDVGPNCTWFVAAPNCQWCTACEAKQRGVDHVMVFNEVMARVGVPPFTPPTAAAELEALADSCAAVDGTSEETLLRFAAIACRLAEACRAPLEDGSSPPDPVLTMADLDAYLAARRERGRP